MTPKQMCDNLDELIEWCDESIEFIREFERQEEMRKWEHEHNRIIEREAKTA